MTKSEKRDAVSRLMSVDDTHGERHNCRLDFVYFVLQVMNVMYKLLVSRVILFSALSAPCLVLLENPHERARFVEDR